MQDSTGNQAFAEEFLVRLHTIFNYLQPGKIKEQERDGVLFFKQKHTCICLYNAYPGSVQLIFNRNLLSNHFEAAHDYVASAQIDWELIIVMISDLIRTIDEDEKEYWPLRAKSNQPRTNKIPKSIPDSPALLPVNCL